MPLTLRSLAIRTPRHTRSFFPSIMAAAAAAMSTAAPPNGTSSAPRPQYTITGLKRWSCGEKKRIPSIEQIKSIHVYDFDNTLFASPLPNRQIWSASTIGPLANPDLFLNGGWWHDVSILAATGEGEQVEEPRAWKGWWNEQIVELVKLSMQQKDALNVLLTGRGEAAYADLIGRMLKSKAMQFDLVCLKPAVGPAGQKFASTMLFKQELLRDLVFTYRAAEEIRIYEDRPKHTAAFRTFFEEFNDALVVPNPPVARKPIVAEVIQVPENATQLEPVTEIAIMQRIVNQHNLGVRNGTAPKTMHPLQITKNVLYTGYLIPASYTEALCKLGKVPTGSRTTPVQTLANNVMIMPRPAPHHILKKVGGMGASMRWRVNGIGCYQNKVWALRVEPVPANSPIYIDGHTPMVVLATRGGAKAYEARNIRQWDPVPENEVLEFESTVGEKAFLSLDEERPGQHASNWGNGTQNENRPPAAKKQRSGFNASNEQEFPALGAPPPKAPAAMLNMNQGAKAQYSTNANRGGGMQNRGRGGFQQRGQGRGGGNRNVPRAPQGPGGNRGGGRGGRQNTYKSLDDIPQSDGAGGGMYDGY